MKIREILLIILLIISVIITVKTKLDSNKRISNLHTAIELKEKEADKWRDRYGRSNAEKQVAEGELEDLKRVYPQLIDSAYNAGRLKAITKIETVTKIDTVKLRRINHKFSYFDKWMTLEGTLDNDSTFTLSGKINNQISLFTSKKGFLNRKTTVQAVSENPIIELTGITSIEIVPSKHNFNIGIQAGYGVTLNGLSPYLGIGLGYNLF